jgi:hypothetical protein
MADDYLYRMARKRARSLAGFVGENADITAPVPLIGRHEDVQACVQLPCAHHVSPRAEKIVNLALPRCQRLSQGVCARRRLFVRPAWPRRTLLWNDYQRESRKPFPPFPPSLRRHVSPRAEKIANLKLSRCQKVLQGIGAHRRLF